MSGSHSPGSQSPGSDSERGPRIEADVELDCRGMRCPLPIIELAKGIEELAVGRTMAVVANDPAARADVPAWCRMRGHEYVGEDTAADGVARFVVRRVS